MTDIDRIIIGIAVFVAGYFVYLFFKKRNTEDEDEDGDEEEYPFRLSKLSGKDHFARPVNNLEDSLNLKYAEAMTHYEEGKFEETIVKLTGCILENRFSEFYYYRGISHFALKKYQEAINDWETAIILFPEYEYELSANIIEARGLGSKE
ncbi:MAG: tetratricopeptide repeat protein [Ignavibacteriae bacterium]|nr:tetratricopeptide repeat protein [Ignavibacteriota bacterium]